MKKKIIVTGGCGYIGSHTVVALIDNHFKVVIIDNLSNSDSSVLDRIEKITGQRPHFEDIDLKNIEDTRRVFGSHKDAVAIIHFAAHKAVAESVQKPLTYYQNNLYALLNTLIIQQEIGIHNFIFSSSATVYGKPDMLPITEKNSIKRPFSPYGNTKKIAEEIMEDLSNTHPKFSAISLRYFNPIGAHESGLLGELPNGIPNNLMPYITQTAVGIRKQLNIYGNDYETRDGTPIRDYIHVVDLADAHVKALQRLLAQKQEQAVEVYNLGTGEGHTVLEIVKSFERVTKTTINYRITDRRDGDVPELYAATTLAQEKLGWFAKRGIDDMIRSSWIWENNIRTEENTAN